MEIDTTPMEYMDVDGSPIGFDVDMAKEESEKDLVLKLN